MLADGNLRVMFGGKEPFLPFAKERKFTQLIVGLETPFIEISG